MWPGNNKNHSCLIRSRRRCTPSRRPLNSATLPHTRPPAPKATTIRPRSIFGTARQSPRSPLVAIGFAGFAGFGGFSASTSFGTCG
ncbi:hypothetical protein M5D96_009170 [Drosophila gunungcola]|uniref:Uncharacterized protein n=1 Tax=Drosophila gunungcola TaxID=103775 RepID=A0A9P9YKD2_9MUSC|nr:hypothetical protein M5D96_009170 [Drosophila gunungcola]